MQTNQNLDHPVRTIDAHATVDNREPAVFGVREKYKLLDETVKNATEYVFLDESKHLVEGFI